MTIRFDLRSAALAALLLTATGIGSAGACDFTDLDIVGRGNLMTMTDRGCNQHTAVVRGDDDVYRSRTQGHGNTSVTGVYGDDDTVVSRVHGSGNGVGALLLGDRNRMEFGIDGDDNLIGGVIRGDGTRMKVEVSGEKNEVMIVRK